MGTLENCPSLPYRAKHSARPNTVALLFRSPVYNRNIESATMMRRDQVAPKQKETETSKPNQQKQRSTKTTL